MKLFSDMIIKNNKIILCGRGKCCPEVKKIKFKNKTHIQITDDYEGKVKLNKDEALMLVNAILKLIN